MLRANRAGSHRGAHWQLTRACFMCVLSTVSATEAPTEPQCQPGETSDHSTGTGPIAHGGLCPAFELTCPPCPSGHVKCPTGSCMPNVRECPGNVNVRGDCNGTNCDEVEWCHLHAERDYACWEVGPSEEFASMRFEALKPDKCGYCSSVHSRYPCNDCCGVQAHASWSGSLHRPGDASRREGGVFMSGSRWVCLLREAAITLGLSNAAAGIAPTAAAAAPSSSLTATKLATTEAEVLAQLDLPEARALLPAEYDRADAVGLEATEE